MPRELQKARAQEMTNKLRYAWGEVQALTKNLEEAGYEVSRDALGAVRVTKQTTEVL